MQKLLESRKIKLLSNRLYASFVILCLVFCVSNTSAQTNTYTTPGSGLEAIPANSMVILEVWGAGGAGSSATGNNSHGSGGGGGAYSIRTLRVSNATNFTYFVGQGGIGGTANLDGSSSSVSDTSGVLVEAGGGSGGTTTGGAGGTFMAGDFGADGGAGATASNTYSGGGGSSARVDTSVNPYDILDGLSAIEKTGGDVTVPYFGGDGADGWSNGNGRPGVSGFSPGGGGSGGYRGSGIIGGNGGNGQVRITIWPLNIWTGTESSEWNDFRNWSLAQVPDLDPAIGNVVIQDVSPNFSSSILTGGTPANVYSLEIEQDGSLTVQTNNSLTVESMLKIDGNLILEDEAQLIQLTGSTFDDTSTGYLQLNQQGTSDIYSYNYWSSPVYENLSVVTGYGASPVNNYTLQDVLLDVIFVDVYDGSPGPPVEIADYWIYKFNDKTAGAYSEWVQIRSTGDIVAGEGYTMKGSGTASSEQNYIFQGKPNNGDITLELNSGNEYLVGNPYPSALDADQFILDNINPNPVFDGTLYFWEHWGGGSHYLSDYQGGYATYNLSGGIIGTGTGTRAADGGTKTPQRYIPVGQGFFINADAGGTVTFNNGQRTIYFESGPSSIFMKTQQVSKSLTEDTRRKLRIGVSMDKGFQKEILLTEDPNTTEKFDYGYDGKLRDGYNHDIYWIIDDEHYAIQGTPKITKNSVFELGVQMEQVGEISLQVNAFENDNSFRNIYLLDRETNTTTEILNNSVTLNLEKGDYKGRFAITFLPAEKPLDLFADLSEGIEAFMNNDFKEIQITRMVEAEISEVAIFNLLGQKMYSTTSNLQDRFIRIPVNEEQGIYLLRIQTDKGATGKQIFIED